MAVRISESYATVKMERRSEHGDGVSLCEDSHSTSYSIPLFIAIGEWDVSYRYAGDIDLALTKNGQQHSSTRRANPHRRDSNHSKAEGTKYYENDLASINQGVRSQPQYNCNKVKKK